MLTRFEKLLIAGVLLVAHDTAAATVPLLTGAYQIVAGLVAGFLIGILVLASR